MKTRKLFLVLGLVVLLLVGTVLVASASDKIRLTGGYNNTFFGMGWEWINVNILLDPATHDAEGKAQYMVYEEAEGPIKFSWRAEALCGAVGEFDNNPTISIVIRIVSVKNIDPSWVGKYAEITFYDGGQNASTDIIGIAGWDFMTNTPLDEMPSCDFTPPIVFYPSQNGNLTIHE